MLTCVTAGDSPVFQAGLRAVADRMLSVEIVATTTDLSAVPRLVTEHDPAVVVLGFEPPPVSIQLAGTLGSVPSVVLTWSPRSEDAVAALRGGVNGFLRKDASLAQLESALLSVVSGALVYPHRYADSIVGGSISAGGNGAGGNGASATEGRHAGPDLTCREAAIVELILQGMSSQQIAHRLGIAPQTVKNHVNRVLQKVGVHSRLQLAAWARRNRLPGHAPRPVDQSLWP